MQNNMISLENVVDKMVIVFMDRSACHVSASSLCCFQRNGTGTDNDRIIQLSSGLSRWDLQHWDSNTSALAVLQISTTASQEVVHHPIQIFSLSESLLKEPVGGHHVAKDTAAVMDHSSLCISLK